MAESKPRFGWGHININVRNLDRAIEFYRKFGFEVFIPAVPYLALDSAKPAKPLPHLVTKDLQRDVADLKAQGVEFISEPTAGHGGLADVAACKDPDGTLIELLQVYLDRWQAILSGT